MSARERKAQLIENRMRHLELELVSAMKSGDCKKWREYARRIEQYNQCLAKIHKTDRYKSN